MWVFTASKIRQISTDASTPPKITNSTQFFTSSNKMLSTQRANPTTTKKDPANSDANVPVESNTVIAAGEVLIADAARRTCNAMAAMAADDLLIADITGASNAMADTAAGLVIIADGMSSTRKSNRTTSKKGPTDSNPNVPAKSNTIISAGEVLIADAASSVSNGMAATAAGNSLIADTTGASNAMADTAAVLVIIADGTTAANAMAVTAAGDVVIADATGVKNAMATMEFGTIIITDGDRYGGKGMCLHMYVFVLSWKRARIT